MSVDITRTAIDGAVVSISTAKKLGPVSSFARYEFGDVGAFAFTAASVETAHGLLNDEKTAGNMAVIEEYKVDGGTLILAEGDQLPDADGNVYMDVDVDGKPRTSPFRMAIWEANGAAVFTFEYGGAVSRLMSVMERFRFSVKGADAVAQLRSSKRVTLSDGPGLTFDLEDTDLVEIVGRNPRRDRTLPRHAGTPVRGGELYVDHTGSDHLPPEPHTHDDSSPQRRMSQFLLVSDSAIATSTVESPSDQGLEIVADVFSNLEVGWERAKQVVGATDGPR